MTVTPTSARLTDLLERSAAELQAAAGGGAVCVFSKAGTPVPGIKYAEGRSAALREVERVARRTTRDIGSVAEQVRSSWSTELDRVAGRGAGPDWIAYRTGGVDALDDLLSGSGSTGSPD